VMFVEFECTTSDLLRLGGLSGAIVTPFKLNPDTVCGCEEGVSPSQRPILCEGFHRQFYGLAHTFRREAVEGCPRPQKMVVSCQVRCPSRCARDFGHLNGGRNCGSHPAGHPILKFKNIVQFSVEPIRPQMCAACRVDELSCDAHSGADLTHASFQNILNS